MIKSSVNETIIWQGKPSQALNFHIFFICAVILLLSFPLYFSISDLGDGDSLETVDQLIIVAMWACPAFYAMVKWLQVKCCSYKLTEARFSERSGILNKITNDLELYRVKDTAIIEPLILRIFGFGNIVLYTSDHATPITVIRAVPNVLQLQSIIRERVERLRDEKRVLQID